MEIQISMTALDKNMRKLLGANTVTRPVDELTDTALIHFVWNFGKAQACKYLC
jgi:hypothetical protein